MTKMRKFWLYVGTAGAIFAASTVALFVDKMTAAEWIDLQKWEVPVLFGLFVTGNGVEHIKEVLKKTPGAK